MWFLIMGIDIGTDGDLLDIDGLALDCSNSNTLAMESLQSCAKPSMLANAT